MIASIIFRRRHRRGGGGKRTRRHLFQFMAAVAGTVAMALVVLVAGTAYGVVSVYEHYAKDLPSAEQIEEMTYTSFETTKIYDRTGQHLLYEVQNAQGGDRTIVPLRDIPLHMQHATIALEDKTFYSNPGGINIEGLVRAFYNNLRGNEIQGGSSIAAQLVRNVVMSPEQRFEVSYERKIKELILSVELTRRYPGREGRDRILEWYLNTVYYGNRAYGVEAAARAYFGKHAKDMTLAECAMLANIPQYPAKNPIDNPEAAKARQALALEAMVAQGYITRAEADAARQAEVGHPDPQAAEVRIEAPHFVMYLLKVMEERYGRRLVYGGGLRVITTLDYDLQNAVQNIVTKTVRSWPASSNARNAASVVIRPSTGEVLAMVGSVDYFDASIDGQVNMAVEPRQPGSSFKPYTYAAAFEQGYNPGSLIVDQRTAFHIGESAPYVPENFDRSYHGNITIRRALACSYNIPAVLMLNRIGVDSGVEMAHRLGITTIRDPRRIGLAVTLGSCEVPLIDHTYGFSVFANGGVMAGVPVPPQRREPGFRQLDPVVVLRATDSRGRVVDEYLQPTMRQVLDPRIAYMIASITSDDNARAPAFGPGSALVASRPASAKTGTTNESWDCWTMGFNPQLAVGVWVGNANHQSMGAWYGAISAAPIWREIMEYAFKSLPPVDYVMPPGIKWVDMDPNTGALPSGKGSVRDLVLEEMEPVSNKKERMQIAICRASGKLATEFCPADQVDLKPFDLYPTKGGSWVRSTRDPQPPTAYCNVHGPGMRTRGRPDLWAAGPVVFPQQRLPWPTPTPLPAVSPLPSP
ncbi:MAG: transglycosylase domain-containing protein [Anaerolineae bacterium]